MGDAENLKAALPIDTGEAALSFEQSESAESWMRE
jgi:hypothetical protein